jgi:hypothetical protein
LSLLPTCGASRAFGVKINNGTCSHRQKTSKLNNLDDSLDYSLDNSLHDYLDNSLDTFLNAFLNASLNTLLEHSLEISLIDLWIILSITYWGAFLIFFFKSVLAQQA